MSVGALVRIDDLDQLRLLETPGVGLPGLLRQRRLPYDEARAAPAQLGRVVARDGAIDRTGINQPVLPPPEDQPLGPSEMTAAFTCLEPLVPAGQLGLGRDGDETGGRSQAWSETGTGHRPSLAAVLLPHSALRLSQPRLTVLTGISRQWPTPRPRSGFVVVMLPPRPPSSRARPQYGRSA